MHRMVAAAGGMRDLFAPVRAECPAGVCGAAGHASRREAGNGRGNSEAEAFLKTTHVLASRGLGLTSGLTTAAQGIPDLKASFDRRIRIRRGSGGKRGAAARQRI